MGPNLNLFHKFYPELDHFSHIKGKRNRFRIKVVLFLVTCRLFSYTVVKISDRIHKNWTLMSLLSLNSRAPSSTDKLLVFSSSNLELALSVITDLTLQSDCVVNLESDNAIFSSTPLKGLKISNLVNSTKPSFRYLEV